MWNPTTGAALATAAVLSSSVAFSQRAPSLDPPERDGLPVQSGESFGKFQTFAAPTTEWLYHKTQDNTHPDGKEQTMLWLMNRARSNPSMEGIFLSDTEDSRVENAIRYFGVDLSVLQAEFAVISAKPPAAFDRRIYQGSLTHSLDLIARDSQDHNNQFQRVEAAGFNYNGASASVFSYTSNPVYGHAGFNIDWGNDGGSGDGMQPGRGHRRGLMNSGNTLLSNVGIAMAPENDPSTRVGPFVTSIVYARADTRANDHYNTFLVGTVWEDYNGNNRYDDGEGLEGVTIMPNQGTYYATTGNAGGYAIPVVSAGMYTLQFSGGALSQGQTRTVEFRGESVLLPWNAADHFQEESTIATMPRLAIRSSTNSITIEWESTSDSEFTLQHSSNGFTWFNATAVPERVGSLLRAQIPYIDVDDCTFFRLARIE